MQDFTGNGGFLRCGVASFTQVKGLDTSSSNRINHLNFTSNCSLYFYKKAMNQTMAD